MTETTPWPQDNQTLARIDLEYARGMKAGWNAALGTMPQAEFNRIMEDRTVSALKVLRAEQ